MSETWDQAVERAMSLAPPAVREAWRKLKAAESAALQRGAAVLVEAATSQKAMPPEEAALMSEMLRVRSERDDLSIRLLETQRATDRWERRALDAEAERDALKARLDALDLAAKESAARVGALTSEMKDREWRARGAPMQGEPTTPGADPMDGHPFTPNPERPELCATCGYAEVVVALATGEIGHKRVPA